MDREMIIRKTLIILEYDFIPFRARLKWAKEWLDEEEVSDGFLVLKEARRLQRY